MPFRYSEKEKQRIAEGKSPTSITGWFFIILPSLIAIAVIATVGS